MHRYNISAARSFRLFQSRYQHARGRVGIDSGNIDEQDSQRGISQASKKTCLQIQQFQALHFA